ncbi:derlin-2.2-like [Olea europaea var. sylvestris]|uniref:derlin-2.2-like n=1 Tax=Olea europaea var. sylvestris TaxID=158386 RepID=UPI000C1D3FA2|nr:derlin-2.2-like [Olea europaea var. sylvestris]
MYVFLYFADLDFLFHMFFLARYCKLLEENSFRGRTADFFYMILFGASVLTGTVLIGGMIPYISESFARIIFLSNSLTFMMVYVWSKQNPYIHMSFLGLFTFTAGYLPWVSDFSFVCRFSDSAVFNYFPFQMFDIYIHKYCPLYIKTLIQLLIIASL